MPGHIHSGMGEEATYAGVLATRKNGDYFKLGHRPVCSPCILGTPLDVFFGEALSKVTGNAGGRGGINHTGRLQDGILGGAGALGCDIGVAVGAALTIDVEGRDNIAYVFFGDGTTNRGPVYEAINLAVAWKAPVLFVCENNQFAISTPISYSCKVENVLADKAPGFGIPSVVVDGIDVLSVYEGAAQMAKYVRAGNGPAMIESKTYRWRGHFEGDQCAYRDAAVTEKWIEEKDCLKLLETNLLKNGVMSESEMEEVHHAFEQEMNAAIARAEAAPEMKPEEIFDGLYA